MLTRYVYDNLSYYRARYYDSNTGRFISEDPAAWSGGNNFYRYSNNSPPTIDDPTGYWPSKQPLPVHQDSIDRALHFLSAADREVLKQAQTDMDKDQSPALSYKHCMRSPDQCVQAAREQSNKWIRTEIEKARAARIAGNHKQMLQHMGNVIHTLQDCTSPAHSGFQVWEGDNFGHWITAAEHVAHEAYDPGPGSALDQATLTGWQYLDIPNLPTDFFAK